MNKDEQNLNLLSIFHYVLGGLTILAACIFIFHIVMGIAMIQGKFAGRTGPPPDFGWMFVLMGIFAVLAGWTIGILMLIAGKKIKERRSRTFCLVVAGLECLTGLLGIALGVFTIVTLMKDSVAALFAANDQKIVPPPVNPG